jgi:hypothetical protein
MHAYAYPLPCSPVCKRRMARHPHVRRDYRAVRKEPTHTMRKQAKAPKAEDTILLGPAQIMGNWLATAPTLEYRQSGVLLCDERHVCTIKIGDTLVEAKINVSITREPVGNEEAAKCADVKDQRMAEKKAKEREQADALAKEKQVMFKLGQESSAQAVFGTLGQIDKLMEVGAMVNRMTTKANEPAKS